MTFSKRDFIRACEQIAGGLGFQGRSYLEEHVDRLYDTFREVEALIKVVPCTNILSVGAGSAYVEMVIKKIYPKVEITVVDFEECIKMNRDVYDQFGLRYVARDICLPLDIGLDRYDLIMACEILEHLPKSPRLLFEELARYVTGGGVILITTPNLARLENVIKLLLAKPILEDPDRTFAPVEFGNEGYHRREYVEEELVELAERAGFEHVKTVSIHNNRKRERIPILLLNTMFKRFRRTMLIIFRYKQGDSGTTQ